MYSWALVEAVQAEYKQAGIDLTQEEALEEVICRSMEGILDDGNVFQQMMEYAVDADPTLFDGIREWLKEFADKLRSIVEAYRGAKPGTAEGQLLQQAEDYLYTAEAVYSWALVETGQKTRTTGDEKTAREGGVRYSIEFSETSANEKILELLEKIQSDPVGYNQKDYVSLGVVDNSISEKIKQTVGIDTEGYEVVIESRQIKHILNDHGPEGNTDQSMADPKSIAKIEYTLRKPDEISDGGVTHAYFNYVNGKNRPVRTVLYERSVTQNGESMYVVQAVPVSSKKKLYVVTAFIGESGYKNRASQFANANSPGATANTAAGNTLIDNVTQERTEVKTKLSRTNPALGEVLAAEDSAIREDLPKLRELVSMLKNVKGGLEFSRRTIESVARVMMDRTGVSGNVKELADILERFYSFVSRGEELTLDRIQEEAREAAITATGEEPCCLPWPMS